MSSAENTAFLSRFIVGIDLGTTNCSLCYIDTENDPRRIRTFPVPQLVAPGELAAEPLLPSFTYLPGGPELPPDALRLPWNPAPAYAVGRFAREQGSRIPERLIASAKSWLAHAGVNRTQPILPWDGDLGPQMASPVQVSFYYLDHLRNAWNNAFQHLKDQEGTPCRLEEQQVIITVPASFDETARELTIQAARQAGIARLTLIEEPLAAFYAWLAAHEDSWKKHIAPGDVIVVIDVGGGTTDFSLIEIDESYTLRRKAVGDHLLLGGDNMDMTLAHLAEAAWKTHLSQRQWTLLCQECRRVKELLLSPDAPESARVQLAGSGSSVLAGARSHTFSRNDVLHTILDGFFPAVSVDTPPPERRRGLQQMGLPYATDPAVTKHLLQFLRNAGQTLSTPAPFAKPTHLLFNGGTLIPASLRQHLLNTVANWTQSTILTELQTDDFSLAVSVGAAFYGRARRGEAVRVKGGIANAYFLEIQTDDDRPLLCVMPRDTEEGIVCQLPTPFLLHTNAPVDFPLYASSTRLGDALGDRVAKTDDITALPPLRTALRYGRHDEQTAIEVHLASQLNEIGTLDVWCQATHSEHRFPLTFELRGATSSTSEQTPATQNTVDENRMLAALALLEQAFRPDSDSLDTIMKAVENALELPRADWTAFTLRRFADLLLQNPDWRSPSPRHESRWLHLLGFCLRPGFGTVGDEERLRRFWKLWHQGPIAPAKPDVAANWHIAWRRVAGGLSAGQQNQFAGLLARDLVSKDLKTVFRKSDPVTLEKWRLLATLEKLPVNLKIKYLTTLLRGTGRLDNDAFWSIARLAARQLFAGPENAVIPAAKLSPLFRDLLAKATQADAPPLALLAIANAARQTGLRTLDLAETERTEAARFLKRYQAPDTILKLLNGQAQQDAPAEVLNDLLGDTLPLGLVLSSQS